MFNSFQEYIKAVFKQWWWLVGGIIGGFISIIKDVLGKEVPIALPLGIAIMFICFSLAQFLAYHELRKENIKLTTNLKEAKSYEPKTQRIEIISKEKYPSETLRILDDMRRCLADMVESADSVTNVEENLMKCIHGDPHDLYRAINQKTIDDNVYVTFSFYRRFVYGIGLIDLQNKNDKWNKLVEELETIKRDIPDQNLKDAVMSHFNALNGVNAIRLIYRYMHKYGTNEILTRTIEPFRPITNLLDETMTRVTKRILELKLGEEPKWEMRYFEIKR